MSTQLKVAMALVVALAGTVPANAQTPEKDAVSSFEQKVGVFQTFVAGRPVLFWTDAQDVESSKKIAAIMNGSSPQLKHSFQVSPTGLLVNVLRFEMATITYDVQKTDSLVSPFRGYIIVNFSPALSSCGDVVTSASAAGTIGEKFVPARETRAFSTGDLARTKANVDSCYGRSEVDSVRFVFAYQGGRWVYKDVDNNGKEIGWSKRLKEALAAPAPNDNAAWQMLIR